MKRVAPVAWLGLVAAPLLLAAPVTPAAAQSRSRPDSVAARAAAPADSSIVGLEPTADASARGTSERREAVRGRPAPASSTAATSAAAPPAAPGAGPHEIPGLLRSTIGFVVPIPGTEMIRVGVVAEGSTLQAANRAPALEGLGQQGLAQATGASITVIIRPPQ